MNLFYKLASPRTVAGVLICLVLRCPGCDGETPHIRANTQAALFAQRGQRVLQTTLRLFRPRGSPRMVEKIPAWHADRGPAFEFQSAFAWPQSIELLMLAAATEYNSAHAPLLKSFVGTLGPYWRMHHGIGGYGDVVAPGPLHRYYDDNEWMTWGFLRAFQATHDPQYLEQAQATFRFVLSGESPRLGGGIFWLEQNRNSKNTCSNAPAIVDALKLYRATRQKRYLQTAQRLYKWVNRRLLDRRDHLYFDHIDLTGRIDRTKWSYNTAAMIIANCQFYRITPKSVFLRRAEQLALAAQKRWVNSTTGAISNPGAFAWVLITAFVRLNQYDKQGKWGNLAVRVMNFVWEHCTDGHGLYGSAWDHPPKRNRPLRLIDQAAVGESYFELADRLRPVR